MLVLGVSIHHWYNQMRWYALIAEEGEEGYTENDSGKKNTERSNNNNNNVLVLPNLTRTRTEESLLDFRCGLYETIELSITWVQTREQNRRIYKLRNVIAPNNTGLVGLRSVIVY